MGLKTSARVAVGDLTMSSELGRPWWRACKTLTVKLAESRPSALIQRKFAKLSMFGGR